MDEGVNKNLKTLLFGSEGSSDSNSVCELRRLLDRMFGFVPLRFASDLLVLGPLAASSAPPTRISYWDTAVLLRMILIQALVMIKANRTMSDSGWLNLQAFVKM